MSSRLIIDGNTVYEIDEDCIKENGQRQEKRPNNASDGQKKHNGKIRKRD